MLAKGVNIPDVEVAYHIHPISDISTYREANARIGRDAKKAFICTLFGAEDEALIQTHKTTFKSINGSSLVIDGESIESSDVPVVTASEILEALAGWDEK
jgi:superfamily II DNA helicase RecQ